jgi:hypothetical protein
MRRPAFFCVVAVALGPLAAVPAAGMNYHRIRSFTEPLGHTWEDELVHVDEDVKEPRVAADTFTVTLNEEHAVPVQVEVLKGTRGAVEKVRLWFKITLPAGGEEWPLRITYNDEGKAAPKPPDPSGASVRREREGLVLSSGACDVLLRDSFDLKDKPAALESAPPIFGARGAGGRAWFGRWQLQSPALVRSLGTAVVAEGPVWAEVRQKYAFVDKGYIYELKVRTVAGEPWIDVLETYRLPETSRLLVLFRDRPRPAEALWMPWFVWREGAVRPSNTVERVDLAARAREFGSGAWTTLRPKWAQARDHAQACLAVGEGRDEPSAGFLMTAPADWVRPYDQFVESRILEGGRGLAFDFPLVEGARHWALLAGPAGRFDSKAKLQRLMRKNADIPLDRVLHTWRFAWRRNPQDPAPHVLTTWKRLQAIRAEFQADRPTPGVRMIRAVLEGRAKGDKELAEFLAGRRQALGGASLDARIYLDRAYQDDFFNPTTYPRRLARALRLADLAAAGRPAGDAQAALLGYMFTDLNYWPGYSNGWGVGNPNFHTDMYAVALYAAALVPDHPHARQWMQAALRNLKDDLGRVVFMPGGAGYECPGYHAYALGHMLEMMRTIQNSGLGDPFRWPEVKATVEFLRNLHTPPDPRLGRRGLAPVGDTHPWQDGAGVLFGLAAAGLKETDPAFAARCMALYRHYYGQDGSGDLVQDVLLVDQSVPEARLEDMDWSSREYPGFGAVLRGRFGSDGEAFATFKCGSARGHYQGDELSFHFFGAGQPVALDWSCGYSPRPDQEHMHNRVNFGDDENMDAVGRVLAFRASPAADLVVGEAETDRLRRMPRYPHEVVWQATYPRRTLARPARCRRFLALVKHPEGSALQDYLVVRDELDAAEPATFNLWVLARSVRQDGRTFHFDGQLAAGAVLYFASPAPDRVKTDRWAWPKRDESSLVPADFQPGKDQWRKGELQQGLRVTAAPGEPFLAVLYPCRQGAPVPQFEPLAGGRGIRVTLGRETEEVFLATDAAKEAGGQAVLRRAGRAEVLLKAGQLPPPGALRK